MNTKSSSGTPTLPGLESVPATPTTGRSAVGIIPLFCGLDRSRAASIICQNHYTGSVPSGKSHYMGFDDAIVVWSIPANCNLASFILWEGANVWELSRLWAPDGHRKNLLTQAISAATKELVKIERPDALVSYADPSVGHHGGIYKAASWQFHGQSDESRNYEHPEAGRVARRAFHSGSNGKTKAEIEAHGWREVRQPGKLRFVKPITKKARRLISSHNKRCSNSLIRKCSTPADTGRHPGRSLPG